MNSQNFSTSTGAQVALQRNHLPSQAEINQSFQLIEQWKPQIESMKQTLSKEEAALSAKRQTVEKAYEEKIAALRKELGATKESLDEESRLTTEPLRTQLAETEKRLQIEQAFISGIRRIPDEIMILILEWHLDGQIPSRRLARVSRGWRALLLKTPSFWCNIEAFFVSLYNVTEQTQVLQKRIALARSTLLDVTLSTRGYGVESSQTNLFQLISKTEIHRWKSLKFSNFIYWSASNHILDNIFHGTPSALQRIEFNFLGSSQDDLFLPVYEMIVRSKPPIEELICRGQIPEPLRESMVFRNVSRIVAIPAVLRQLPLLNNLQEIYIYNWYGSTDISSVKTPPFPMRTTLDGIISANQLNNLQTHGVQHLEVRSLDHSGSSTTFSFPELLSLSIEDDGLQSIKHILAPKLAKLELKIPSKTSNRKKLESTMTASLLHDNPQHLTIRPTSLTINLGINTTAVLAILQYWPQLQSFTLVFGKEFAWKGSFPNSLSKVVNPVCPQLITLRMDSRSPDFGDNMEQWERLAKVIILSRKNMPLKMIEWRHNYGEWHRLTSSS